MRGQKKKQISTHLEQKKEEEGIVEEAVNVREEEERGPVEWLQGTGVPMPSIRLHAQTPRRAGSPERAGGEQDIVTIVDRSLKMNEIRGLRKDFTRHPNEPIVTWLLRCWDSGANSVAFPGDQCWNLCSSARWHC